MYSTKLLNRHQKDRHLNHSIHKIVLFFFTAIFALINYPSNCNGQDDKESDWKSIETKKGIEIFSRKINGLEFNEYRGVTQIKTTLASLVVLLEDTLEYTSWLHFCKDARIIKNINNTESYLYFVYEISTITRDMILYTCIFKNSRTDTIFIKLNNKSFNTTLPFIKQSKFKHISKLATLWMFILQDNGFIKVIYQNYVDPTPMDFFVKWKVNSKVKELTFKTLDKLRNKVKEEKYSKPEASILEKIPTKKSCIDTVKTY